MKPKKQRKLATTNGRRLTRRSGYLLPRHLFFCSHEGELFAFNRMRAGAKVKLIAHNGNLYTDRSLITCPHLLAAISEKRLMLIAPEADQARFSRTIGIEWPEFDAKMLRSALLESRRLGFIPSDVSFVTLPNGVEFSINPQPVESPVRSEYMVVRESLRKLISDLLPDHLYYLRSQGPEFLASLLDSAAVYKKGFVSSPGEGDNLLFSQPSKTPEETVTSFLIFLCDARHKLEGKNNVDADELKRVLLVWICSLGAITFPEQRLNGRLMWKELSRGFPFCRVFSPKRDVVEGLEPYDELIKHDLVHRELPPNLERGMDSVGKIVWVLLAIIGFLIGFAIYLKTHK